MPKGKGALGIAEAVKADGNKATGSNASSAVQISFSCPKELRTALKVAAAKAELTMGEYLENLLRRELGL
jgi:hypothetical protein